MKVMSPVSSFDTCKLQVQAGADEIYVGVDDDTFQNIGFSGRGRYNFEGKRVNPSFDELKEIVKFAHSNNVIVNFAANTVFKSNSVDDKFQKAYLNYVDMGVQAGVDHIIVGDLGNLILLNEQGIKIPLVASVFLAAFNSETIDFLKSWGVFRVVLPHHLRLEEINELKKMTNIELEIFAGVGCSNIDGRCGFLHNSGENLKLGIPCKAKYTMKNGYQDSILDATLDCLLCSMSNLYDIGVDVIKIIGRDQNIAFTSAMTKIHKDLIIRISQGERIDKLDIDKYLEQIPWWKNEFCEKSKCKYKEVPIVKSFI